MPSRTTRISFTLRVGTHFAPELTGAIFSLPLQVVPAKSNELALAPLDLTEFDFELFVDEFYQFHFIDLISFVVECWQSMCRAQCVHQIVQ